MMSRFFVEGAGACSGCASFRPGPIAQARHSDIQLPEECGNIVCIRPRVGVSKPAIVGSDARPTAAF